MLVLSRETGKIEHTDFRAFTGYLRETDALVLNNTKVFNARLIGRRATGGKVELFLLEPLQGGRYKALIRPSKKIKEGENIYFEKGEVEARLVTKRAGGSEIEFSPLQADIGKLLEEAGSVPLPPYIKRGAEPLDSERYQTVYAKVRGATAAPTAGLHFTDEILKNIASKGVKSAHVTLHVSYGTFAPVKTEDVTEHKMHSESFDLTEDAAGVINSVKDNGGKVIAVGTTSCRVLETCAEVHRLRPGRGKTDLFIYPGYEFKIVDALLTNFHLPKSTLMMLVSAFSGQDLILKAYEEAIARKYRFYSYGDCMLII